MTRTVRDEHDEKSGEHALRRKQTYGRHGEVAHGTPICNSNATFRVPNEPI